MNPFAEILVIALTLLGSGFGVLAAIGVVRMPDLYTRMQSATKAGTLGVACAVLAAAVYFGTAATAAKAVIVVLFLFGTAPIASHLIARAAYNSGVPLWKQTTRNDLETARRRGQVVHGKEPEPGHE